MFYMIITTYTHVTDQPYLGHHIQCRFSQHPMLHWLVQDLQDNRRKAYTGAVLTDLRKTVTVSVSEQSHQR
jgi:hypothetical protein